jgi:hypothetical protein
MPADEARGRGACARIRWRSLRMARAKSYSPMMAWASVMVIASTATREAAAAASTGLSGSLSVLPRCLTHCSPVSRR